MRGEPFTELAGQEKKRTSRSASRKSLLRLGILLAIIVAVVVVGALLIRSWVHSREVAAYQAYVADVSDIIKLSDAEGKKLSTLLLEPGDATRKDVQTKLDQYQQTCTVLTEEAMAVAAPKDLKEAHQWFVAILQLRSRGLENLKPAIMNALDAQDIEVPSQQVTRAMQLLILSDVAYDEFFSSRAASVLKEKQIPEVNVVSSRFVDTPELATVGNVKEMLTAFKSSDNLQTIHGLAMVQVVAMPSETDLTPGNTFNLPSTDQLHFIATIENQGNMVEKDVPVTIQLTAANDTQPQIRTVKVPEIKPKEELQIRFDGISPTDYGEKAHLMVEVGPVPGEKNLDNNRIETNVIFTL
jgi:hypothetical protein